MLHGNPHCCKVCFRVLLLRGQDFNLFGDFVLHGLIAGKRKQIIDSIRYLTVKAVDGLFKVRRAGCVKIGFVLFDESICDKIDALRGQDVIDGALDDVILQRLFALVFLFALVVLLFDGASVIVMHGTCLALAALADQRCAAVTAVRLALQQIVHLCLPCSG